MLKQTSIFTLLLWFRSRSRDRHRDRDRERHRDHDRHRGRDRDRERRERRRSKSREKRRRSRSKSKERKKSRSPERERRPRSNSKSPMRYTRYFEKGNTVEFVAFWRFSLPVMNWKKIELLSCHMAMDSLIFVNIYIYVGFFSLFRQPGPELTPEERDARTVFCMQLSARIRPRDLEEFFSSVGKVCECYNLKCVKYTCTKINL